MKKELKDEDKFLECENNQDDYFCSVKRQYIANGYASKRYCKNCKEFKKDG